MDQDHHRAVRGGADASLLAVSLPDGRTDNVTDRWAAPVAFRNIDVSPDNTVVVMDASADGQTDLWTANLDGSNLRRLTSDPFVDRRPIWIAAGAIAFQSNRGGQLDLWQLSTSTGRLTQLTSSQSVEEPTGASQNGSLVALEQMTNRVNLWRHDLSSSTTKQLTDDALSDFWPSLPTTNGAFQRAKPRERGAGLRILIGDASAVAGAEPQAVGDGFGVRLSADGAWIAYYQRPPDATSLRLIARNLATGEERRLSDACVPPGLSTAPIDWIEQNMTWSPSSAQLYYVVGDKIGREIHVADLRTAAAPQTIVALSGTLQIRDVAVAGRQSLAC
jgi:Tol biopolymer transport system component